MKERKTTGEKKRGATKRSLDWGLLIEFEERGKRVRKGQKKGKDAKKIIKRTFQST